MLIEKSGNAVFYVQEPGTTIKLPVNNEDFLTKFQEKNLSTQPDFILEYAHFLKSKYTNYQFSNGIDEFTFSTPEITADIFVTLNGRRSQRFIDSSIDLSTQNNNWLHKSFILPQHYK